MYTTIYLQNTKNNNYFMKMNRKSTKKIIFTDDEKKTLLELYNQCQNNSLNIKINLPKLFYQNTQKQISYFVLKNQIDLMKSNNRYNLREKIHFASNETKQISTLMKNKRSKFIDKKYNKKYI